MAEFYSPASTVNFKEEADWSNWNVKLWFPLLIMKTVSPVCHSALTAPDLHNTAKMPRESSPPHRLLEKILKARCAIFGFFLYCKSVTYCP